jgi:hypothetical protein
LKFHGDEGAVFLWPQVAQRDLEHFFGLQAPFMTDIFILSCAALPMPWAKPHDSGTRNGLVLKDEPMESS